MSKTSYALIGVIFAALLYMGAARLYERWQQHVQLKQEQQANDGEEFSFQHKPISLAAPQVEWMKDPVKYNPNYPEIYFEDVSLSEQDAQQQAQQTVSSILQDFNSEPALAQFNEELAQVSQGQVQGLEDLSTQNLRQLLRANPKVREVLDKHMQQKEFAQLIEQIFANPQFKQSVYQLQGGQPAVARDTAK